MTESEMTIEGMTTCPLCLWTIPYYWRKFPCMPSLSRLSPSGEPADHQTGCRLPDIFEGWEGSTESVQAVRTWLDQEFPR